MESITFTKDQFEKLLKLIYLGEWMINAHRIDNRLYNFEELEQLLYAYATRNGLKHLVEISDTDDTLYPSRRLEEEVDPHLKEFKDDNFWTELIDKLSFRDAKTIYGTKHLSEMSMVDRFTALGGFEENYDTEFCKHGVANLFVIKDGEKLHFPK